jgi:hypothetical protein
MINRLPPAGVGLGFAAKRTHQSERDPDGESD